MLIFCRTVTLWACLLVPSIASASALELADIISVDELGYECIAAEFLEETDHFASIAFSIGKKVRLPRTCLPDPCERALTQTELSNLTGTDLAYPRFQEEWNDYYARYADVCRKETVATTTADELPNPPKNFGSPLQGNPTFWPKDTSILVNRSPIVPSSSGTRTTQFPVQTGTGSVFETEKQIASGGVSRDTQQLTPIPLPNSLSLLVCAALLIFLLQTISGMKLAGIRRT